MPRTFFIVVSFWAAVSAFAHSPAFAHESIQPSTENEPEIREPSLEFRLLVGAYLPRISGSTSLGTGPGVNFCGVESLDLDHLVGTPLLELSISTPNHWEFLISGLLYEESGSGLFGAGATPWGPLTLNSNDQYAATMEIGSIGVEVIPPLWVPFDTEQTLLRFAPFVGLRWFHVEQSISIVGEGTESVSGEWYSLLLGANLQLRYDIDNFPWMKSIQVDMTGAIGPTFGSGDGVVYHVRGGVVFYVTENVGVELGYRLYNIDADDGPYSVDVALQGLFIGGAIRF